MFAHPAAEASTPTPIDSLTRRVFGVGGVEYTLSATYHPAAMESIVSTDDGPVLQRTLSHQFGLELSLQYKLSDAISLVLARGVSETETLVERTKLSAPGGPAQAATLQRSTGSHGAYGVSWKPWLGHRLDPALRLQADGAGGAVLSASISSIADPTVLSARFGLVRQGGIDSIDITLGAGFVANDRVSLGASVSHRTTPGRALMPLTTVGVRVGYVITRFGKEVGVTSNLYLSGGASRVGFGVYWQGEGFSW